MASASAAGSWPPPGLRLLAPSAVEAQRRCYAARGLSCWSLPAVSPLFDALLPRPRFPPSRTPGVMIDGPRSRVARRGASLATRAAHCRPLPVVPRRRRPRDRPSRRRRCQGRQERRQRQPPAVETRRAAIQQLGRLLAPLVRGAACVHAGGAPLARPGVERGRRASRCRRRTDAPPRSASPGPGGTSRSTGRRGRVPTGRNRRRRRR